MPEGQKGDISPDNFRASWRHFYTCPIDVGRVDFLDFREELITFTWQDLKCVDKQLLRIDELVGD